MATYDEDIAVLNRLIEATIDIACRRPACVRIRAIGHDEMNRLKHSLHSVHGRSHKR